MVDQPGGFRIDAIAIDQPFGEARHQFGRCVLARVYGAERDQLGAVRVSGRGGQVGDAQRAHLVALRGVLGFLPAWTDGVDLDQTRMRGHQVIHGLVGTLDSAIAGKAGNARIAAGAKLDHTRAPCTLGSRHRLVQFCTGDQIDRHVQTFRTQQLDATLVGFHAQGLLLAIHAHMLEVRGGTRQRLGIRILRLDHPLRGLGVGRACGSCGQRDADREQCLAHGIPLTQKRENTPSRAPPQCAASQICCRLC